MKQVKLISGPECGRIMSVSDECMSVLVPRGVWDDSVIVAGTLAPGLVSFVEHEYTGSREANTFMYRGIRV